jgi:hypothetical protein
MEAKAAADAVFGEALESAHRAYETERSELLSSSSGPDPSGGVGGTAEGVKCLHAHFAHHAAGGQNPVGRLVASWVEPLDCSVPCVVDDSLNPEWVNLP